MSRVIIIVNSEVKASGKHAGASPVTEKMVAALKSAIAADSPTATVEVLAATALWSQASQIQLQNSNPIYCPLTIQLPDWFDFPARDVYKACRDIEGRRQWVERHLAYKTSIRDSWLGDLWLPVVLTAKKTLYGEVIGDGAIPNSYEQPVDLTNELRKSLYYLADRLLESLSASPAVYLLQFRLIGKEIVFDRLWPFPAAPAIASIGSQQPDLFACHWQCLLGKPLRNLKNISKSLTLP